ncbi:MAG: T9SS type A sorting domain-containing protein [Bacteroidota bacterium]
MKSICLLFALAIIYIPLKSQTLIATSNNPQATANHNQRKIVRDSDDNVYVVFADSLNHACVIKGLMLHRSTLLWDTASIICSGQNPTLAITDDNQISLLYESNDSLRRIMITTTSNFISWTAPVLLSDSNYFCHLPVADIDSAQKLNAFWIQKNSSTDGTLIYACLSGDSIISTLNLITKTGLNDIAVACHLQYTRNDLYSGIHFSSDSLLFFHSTHYMMSYDTTQITTGSFPCITYNSYSDPSFPNYNTYRLLFINPADSLYEIQYMLFVSSTCPMPFTNVSYVCIDDVAYPLGYSFLFLSNGELNHSFSYGCFMPQSILSSYTGSISNPSIAYKHFNIEFVDFIWMVNNAGEYQIFYKRDEKLPPIIGAVNEQPSSTFSITGYPNPFSEEITIVVKAPSMPELNIYNSLLQLVAVLRPESIDNFNYTYKWKGTGIDGKRLKAGTYIIRCTAGKNRTARKVVLN